MECVAQHHKWSLIVGITIAFLRESRLASENAQVVTVCVFVQCGDVERTVNLEIIEIGGSADGKVALHMYMYHFITFPFTSALFESFYRFFDPISNFCGPGSITIPLCETIYT